MLASITPLGQRSRHSSWGVTVTAFVVASTVTGGALGAAAGWLGGLSAGGHGQLRVWLLAGALAAGLLLDAGVRGLRPPSPRRQVNEDWMYEYRGWVYGAGFGAQLGLGVATIVSTAAVYVTFAAALLSGGALTGALVGACFGLVRGASILAGARAAGLLLDAGVRGLRPPSPRRQVNEDWMYEYRGWVYGAGFGAQLGLGVATIVSTAAVYVTFAAALLSGGALTGALVGACFGLVRGASILAGARVHSADELRRVHLGLQRWRAPARATGLVLQAALLALALAAAGAAT
ncbi:MAG: hypothetical protein E6G30_07290 [Actinobacteria bacterium]|nr:MAG: hypothetical protein E6G30_07290 [Actinomycetota bacterium]